MEGSDWLLLLCLLHSTSSGILKEMTDYCCCVFYTSLPVGYGRKWLITVVVSFTLHFQWDIEGNDWLLLLCLLHSTTSGILKEMTDYCCCVFYTPLPVGYWRKWLITVVVSSTLHFQWDLLSPTSNNLPYHQSYDPTHSFQKTPHWSLHHCSSEFNF